METPSLFPEIYCQPSLSVYNITQDSGVLQISRLTDSSLNIFLHACFIILVKLNCKCLNTNFEIFNIFIDLEQIIALWKHQNKCLIMKEILLVKGVLSLRVLSYNNIHYWFHTLYPRYQTCIYSMHKTVLTKLLQMKGQETDWKGYNTTVINIPSISRQ